MAAVEWVARPEWAAKAVLRARAAQEAMEWAALVEWPVKAVLAALAVGLVKKAGAIVAWRQGPAKARMHSYLCSARSVWRGHDGARPRK